MIEMMGVTRTLGDGTTVLKDATCRIGAGEFVAVVGPSGSGKTTLLSLIGLLDRPTSGSYRLAGHEVATLRGREINLLRGQLLGFVFQNAYMVSAQRTIDNVTLGLRVRGVPRQERERLATRALERVGLADALHKPAGALSGGEKQRVALARALVTAPEVILADEPTGALDSASTHALIELLREVNAAGTTVVVVTHDPLVAEAAGRVVRLRDGVLYQDGEPC
jgi:putative ABC transport system ATP-binding protein